MGSEEQTQVIDNSNVNTNSISVSINTDGYHVQISSTELTYEEVRDDTILFMNMIARTMPSFQPITTPHDVNVR